MTMSRISVPAMISDLSDSSLVGHPLEGLLFGGAPAPDSLIPRARKAFPTATMYVDGSHLTLCLPFSQDPGIWTDRN